VDGAEELEGEAPASPGELEQVGVIRESLGQPRVERRAERLEVLRLAADVGGDVVDAGRGAGLAQAA
jgi:hypothetical protein